MKKTKFLERRDCSAGPIGPVLPKRSLIHVGLLLGAFCFTSIALQAREVNRIYMVGLDGSIQEMDCTQGFCTTWSVIDQESPETFEPSVVTPLVTLSGYGYLYQLHHNPSINDFTMWEYEGSRGWNELDSNGATKSLVAGPMGYTPYLFQLHNTGRLWQFTGAICNAGGCPGWILLDSNLIKQIVVAGGYYNGQTNNFNIPPLVQLHYDGPIWQYTGTPCNATGCPGWRELDRNPAAVQIAGFPDGGMGASSEFPNGSIFQLRNDGSIWSYTGTPCNRTDCPGWKQIDFDPNVTGITAATPLNRTAGTSLGTEVGRVYKLRNDGSVLELESPFNWVQRDSSGVASIAAAGNGLVELDGFGAIRFAYDASDCYVCGWQSLNNDYAVAIAVASVDMQ